MSRAAFLSRRIGRAPGFYRQSFVAAASLAAVASAVVFCSAGRYFEAAGASAIAITSALLLAGRVPVEAILIFWLAATPVLSFFVRFPVEKSIITFDRAIFAGLALVLFVRSKQSGGEARPLRLRATKFEIFWALLSLAAVASVAVKSEEVGYAGKLALDSFILPLLAFHIARNHFRAKGRGAALVMAAVALALILFATGAFEFLSGTNLLQYKGSELVREGERRVNGPFASDSSYAIICLLISTFLLAAPKIFRVRMDAGAQLLHALALSSVVIATLLPLFRAVAFALAIGWIIYAKANQRREGRRARAAGLSTKAALLLIGSLTASAVIAWAALFGVASLTERLASPRNVYGRLATWEAAAKIALENPASGVGLGNYTRYYSKKYSSTGDVQESILETRAASSPHSNLFWIAAELGLVACLFYVAAFVFIFLMGYRALVRARTPEQRAAAACYIAIASAYSISGLTLTSGAYSDLNLYFFFLLGLLLSASKGGREAA
ncbi:MAG TPA: O-antigen ligase family protein [Blastocatellia bacterium]|nr:O-antigen ligase family protein [Blastocatellia bacterium]